MAFDPMALLSVGSNIIGGLFGADKAAADRKAQIDLHNQATAEADFRRGQDRTWAWEDRAYYSGREDANNARNEALQREFAKSSIQWRADDARAAGLHPLAAIGGAGAMYSPSSVAVGGGSGGSNAAYPAPPNVQGGGSPMGAAFSAIGQDLSRAMNATRSYSAREEAFRQTVQEMELQHMTLKNDLLMSQIQRLKVNSNPPMPTDGINLPFGKTEGVTPLYAGNGRIDADRTISDTNEFTNRYGEFLGDWVFGPYVAWRDYLKNTVVPGSQRFEARRREWHGEPATFQDRWLGTKPY